MSVASKKQFEPETMLNDRYLLVSELGSGCFGTVYKAFDIAERAYVAVKVPSPQIPISGIIAEFCAVRRIDSPYVAKCLRYAASTGEGNSDALVFEYVDGQSLGTWAEKNRDNRIEATRIVLSVLSGLRAAHDLGIFHRDIQPWNILITQDKNIKIIDFGNAVAEAGLSRVGANFENEHKTGHMYFQDPFCLRNLEESVGNSPLNDDGPSKREFFGDLFSVGSVLYFVLTERVMSVAVYYALELDRTADEQIRISLEKEDFFEALCAWIWGCVCFNLEKRFTTLDNAAAALEGIVAAMEEAEANKMSPDDEDGDDESCESDDDEAGDFANAAFDEGQDSARPSFYWGHVGDLMNLESVLLKNFKSQGFKPLQRIDGVIANFAGEEPNFEFFVLTFYYEGIIYGISNGTLCSAIAELLSLIRKNTSAGVTAWEKVFIQRNGSSDESVLHLSSGQNPFRGGHGELTFSPQGFLCSDINS